MSGKRGETPSFYCFLLQTVNRSRYRRIIRRAKIEAIVAAQRTAKECALGSIWRYGYLVDGCFVEDKGQPLEYFQPTLH